MATTKPANISTSGSTVVRTAVTTADSATINDTNYPPGDLTHGAGWNRVLVFPRFVAGTSPTATLQVLHRAGSSWVLGETSDPLADGAAWTPQVSGRAFYVRVVALTGTPTNVSVHCCGWEPFKYDGPAGG
jgi:hypothetical protein